MMIENNFLFAVALCFLISAYAVWEGIRLNRVIRRILPKVRDRHIQAYWAYKHALIEVNGEDIAFQRAEDTINLDAIFRNEGINARHYLAIPSQLIGAGVLFTFLGLAMGLWAFDMEQLEESIKNFISALSIKFFTSIAGMSSAIIFNAFEKHRFHQLEMAINGLCLALDRDYYQPYERHVELCLFRPFAAQQNQQLSQIADGIVRNTLELEQLKDDIRAIKGGMAQLTENIRRNIELSFSEINGQIAAYNQRRFEELYESSKHSLELLQGLFETSASNLNGQLEKWSVYLQEQDAILNKSSVAVEALPASVLQNLSLIQKVSGEINANISMYSDNWTNAVSLQEITVRGISTMLQTTLPDWLQALDNAQSALTNESAVYRQQLGELKTVMASVFEHINALNGEGGLFQKSISQSVGELAEEIKKFSAGAEKKSHYRLATDETYYTTTPDTEGYFRDNEFFTYQTQDALYKMGLTDSPDRAEFEFINQPKSVRLAIRYPKDALFRACENDNTFNPAASQIITLEKGLVRKQGEKWQIVRKAKIRYVA